jgi:hypothetical protein
VRDQQGHHHEYPQREDVLRLGDRELVDRRDEVVVEQQARDDRRAECGDEPADETDDYHGQEEQQ